jgi:subtilase family serine protease
MKKKVYSIIAATVLCSGLIFTGQAPNSRSNTIGTTMQTFGRFRRRHQVAQSSVYQPSQLEHAYGIDKLTQTGQNQKIAIIDAYGSSTIQKDLNSFDSKYNLSSANLQIYYPQGTPKTSDEGWAEETSLDVEWAHALAPKATIDLIVAKSTSTTDLLSAVDYASNLGVQVVSMSWGNSEFSGETALDSHFQHSGTVYIAASGDNGAGAQWPASSPSVLAVGGTTLPLDSQGNLKTSETGWSDSGGGISRYEAEPSYQKTLNISSNNHRAIPDVSFVADPNTGVEVDYNSSWYTVGGTSLATPCWAAFIALADQNSSTPLSNVQNQLYSLAKTQYATNFRDITSGNNGGYSAKTGYDLVTGIGTPLENNLLSNLK